MISLPYTVLQALYRSTYPTQKHSVESIFLKMFMLGQTTGLLG